jgi:hypothetical protein
LVSFVGLYERIKMLFCHTKIPPHPC